MTSLSLPPAAASVREGRRFVTETLEAWGLDGFVETAVLLTSELLTNSVLHARTDIELSLSRAGDGIEVVVRDGSQFAPRRRKHAREATTGRGIELLERLAQSWDVTLHEGGKSIRFTLEAAVDPWAEFADANWEDVEL